MKNFYLFFLITFFSISLGAQEKSNNVAYEDTNVRFTVISDGTIRMEYAPDGKFINQHSFLAVERNYPAVKFKLKKGAWIELSSSNIKYIDNQLVTVIKIQMICKCKYKTI